MKVLGDGAGWVLAGIPRLPIHVGYVAGESIGHSLPTRSLHLSIIVGDAWAEREEPGRHNLRRNGEATERELLPERLRVDFDRQTSLFQFHAT